jgi:TctA family transporter
MEENLRRSMVISGGDPSIFVTRPISLGLLLATLGLVLVMGAAPLPQDPRRGVPGGLSRMTPETPAG